jgi:DoxX-like family
LVTSEREVDKDYAQGCTAKAKKSCETLAVSISGLLDRRFSRAGKITGCKPVIAEATMSVNTSRQNGQGRAPRTRVRVTLWVVQSLLAALFLFAGTSKFIMPAAEMARQMPVALPIWFIHFIGACEVAGAIGLVLPTLLRIRPELTPLAAGGLIIIMTGATIISALLTLAAAVLPFVVGLLCLFVAYGRARVAPVSPRLLVVRPVARNVGLVRA